MLPVTPMQVADIVSVENRWTDAGSRVIMRPGRDRHMRSAPYERGKLNTPGLSGVHWHPKDVGLIVETAQSTPPEAWLYAGTAWLQEPRRDTVATGFCGAEIACDNPTELAKLWARGLGASLGADGVSVLLGELIYPHCTVQRFR